MSWVVRKNIYVFKLIRVLSLFPRSFKSKFYVLFFSILLNSVLDLLSLGMLIPVVGIVLKEGYIQKNNYLFLTYNTLGFSNELYFSIFLLGTLSLITILKNVGHILISRYQANISYQLQTYISSNTLQSSFFKNFLLLKKKNSNHYVWETNILPGHFIKFVLLPLFTLVNEFIIFLIITIGLFLYDPKIILLLLVVIFPITAFFYRTVKTKIQSYQNELADLFPKLSMVIQQSIFGFVDVVLTGTKSFFFGEQKKLLDRVKSISTNLFTYMQMPAKIIETAVILSIVALIVYSKLFITDKERVISLISLFAIAAYRLIPSVNKITVSILNMKGYDYTLNYLTRSLNRVNSYRSEKGGVKISPNSSITFQKEIRVSDLTFSYDGDTKVLDKVSLSINRGESIGIIGKSGSGKTTLMNILLGLITEYEGVIKVDGTALSKSTRIDWYKKVGYVQQNIFILDGTIRENIAFGMDIHDIDEDLLESCVNKANLSDFIHSLPEGLDTKVGELGGMISGGQRQRIGIARALYSGAEILFFDEATSALDNETEKMITESLNKLSETSNGQITMIIIAHRLSTLTNCDRVIELQKGKINNNRAV